MSIPLLIDETKTGRSGAATISQHGRRWKKSSTTTRTWRIIANRVTDTEPTILSSVGVPRLGSFYHGMYCKKIAARDVKMVNIGGRPTKIWELTADFDDQIEKNPLELPPEVVEGAEEFEETVWEDIEGNPITNKNGERIPMTEPRLMSTLRITRYEPANFNSAQWNLKYARKINTATFWGWPAKTAYMLPVQGKFVRKDIGDEKLWFYHATYSVRFRTNEKYPDPWTRRPLHYGNKVRDAIGSPPHRYRDKETNALSQTNLDINGLKLADDATGVFLEFKVLGEVDFSEAGIDKHQLNWDLEI